MAVAGDILIKLAVDLAEFSANMTEAASKFDDFAKKAQQTGDTVEGFIGLVKKGVAALGVEELVRGALDYAEAVAKQASEISTQAAALGLSTEALQAYQAAALASGQNADVMTTAIAKFNVAIGEAAQGGKKQIDALKELGVYMLDANGQQRSQSDLMQEAATRLLAMTDVTKRATIEVALFGKTGQQINPVLQELSKGVGTLQDQFKNYIIPQSTITELDDLAKKTELSQKQIAAFVATIYAPLKESVFAAIARDIDDMNKALAATKPYESLFDKALAYLRQRGSIGGTWTPEGNVVGKSQEAIWAEDVAKLNAQIEKNQQLIAQGGRMTGRGTRVMGNLPAETEAMIRQRNELQGAAEQAGLSDAMRGVGTGTTPRPGVSNPSVAGAGQSTVDAIARLKAEADAANKAYAALMAGYEQPLEALNRSVALQKQIDDTIAKLGTKADAAGYKAALTAAATAADMAASKLAQLKKDEAEADATQLKLGDGTASYAKIVDDLNRQLDTHRLKADAYNRTLKEQTEAWQEATLAAKRYDDNLGSLTAGFEDAALKYKRSNDLFTAGGEIFNGLTTAMNEGLQSLQGQSTKTFGQIALDFVNMLEQMAVKSAASQVFNFLVGSMSGMAGAGTPGNPYYGPVAPGSGGFLSSIFGSIFGGAHQTGGVVGPGQSFLVGEAGPEMFVPTVAGSIVPSMAASGSSGSGVTVNVAMSSGGAPNAQQTAAFAQRVKQAVVDTIVNEKRPGGTLYAGAA
jgi:hypothetical protein